MASPAGSPLNLTRHDPVFVGLDIGGTKTEVLLVSDGMDVLGRLRGDTDTTGPQRLLDATKALIYRGLAAAEIKPIQVAGIGIGIPGQVDLETGVVRLAVNLNLEAYPLGTAVAAEFGAPVLVENDVRLAAMGVYRWLQGREPVHHMAYLSIGTGVSAGIVINGRLYRGASGMAGEIGHLSVVPDGERCSCGARGCLETILSGPAVARLYNELVRLPRPVTANYVYAAAQQDDAAAQKVIRKVSHALSRAIQGLFMAYDVEKVVLGGGVTRAGVAFLKPVLAELSRLQQESELAHTMLSPDKIVVLPPDYNAGTWGAVKLVQKLVHSPIAQVT